MRMHAKGDPRPRDWHTQPPDPNNQHHNIHPLKIQAQRLRGLQTVGPAAVEPTTEFWAEEINAQIAVLREKLVRGLCV